MGFAKDFGEMLAKEKWVVYLFLLWAGAFFFWGVEGLLGGRVGGNWVIEAVANLLYLVAGIVLALFAAKFMRIDPLAAFSKERLFAYFLMLWGGASFFFAVSDLLYFGPYLSGDATAGVALIASLFYLLSGAVLVLLGFKLFQSKDT